MAYELHIRDAPPEAKAKIRSPVWVVVWSGLTIIVYQLVWWYRINRELRDFGRARGYDLGQSPTTSVLAMFPGLLLLFIPYYVTMYKTGKRIQGGQRVAGRTDILNGWLAVALVLVQGIIFFPIWVGYFQSELNKIWQTEGEPLPGVPPHPSMGQQMTASGPLPPASPAPSPPAGPEAVPGAASPPQGWQPPSSG